jgi:bifunctional non-homologous end joining protein LigD
LASLPNGNILDGEVCMLDDIGRSDFMRLQARSRRRGRPAGSDPVVFCAFDLLVHRGQDMRAKPLKQRKAKLARALEKPLAHVLLVQDMPDKVAWLYEQALALQLEGIVAKRLDSPYLAGVRSDNWLKIKRPGAIPAQRFKR